MITTRFHIAALTFCLCAGIAAAQSAASPADRLTREGSTFTHFPLGRPNARFQFLYGDLPPLMVLHGHAYRRDAIGVRGHVDNFTADLSVALSIAPLAASQASATFQNNSGTSPTVVLPRQLVTFVATDRPLIDPATSFDLTVPYAVPFLMPASPPTLCVDMTMYGNSSAAGVDRNLSIYLDGHDYNGGHNEQPGFRMGGGCAAPGNQATMYANLSLLHLGSSMQIDIAARDGVADDGSGTSRTFLCLGTQSSHQPLPGTALCSVLTSTEIWYLLPGNNSILGNFDGRLPGLALLRPGYRLWLQTGSVNLANGDLALGDLSTLITPPAAPSSAPAARIAASSDRTALSGAVSFSVPVTLFF